MPAILGGGPVNLDERTVTKFDFGILSQQLETQEGSGGVRSSLLDDGPIVSYVGKLVPRAG